VLNQPVGLPPCAAVPVTDAACEHDAHHPVAGGYLLRPLTADS